VLLIDEELSNEPRHRHPQEATPLRLIEHATPENTCVVVIDDLQPGYSETGSGWTTYVGGGYGNELRYRAAADTSSST